MDSGGSRWSVGDWHIPTVVAAVIWFSTALAVIGYTFIALKETAGGGDALDSAPPGQGAVANPSFVPPGPQGPLPGTVTKVGAPPGMQGPLPQTRMPKSGSAPK